MKKLNGPRPRGPPARRRNASTFTGRAGNALSVGLPRLIDEVEESHRVLGEELWDYSLEGSRTTLEALMQYLHEQGLTRRRMPLEELFVLPAVNCNT